jgi:hypothetical protein
LLTDFLLYLPREARSSQGEALACRLETRETAVKPYVLMLLVLTITVYADFFVKWNRRAN